MNKNDANHESNPVSYESYAAIARFAPSFFPDRGSAPEFLKFLAEKGNPTYGDCVWFAIGAGGDQRTEIMDAYGNIYDQGLEDAFEDLADRMREAGTPLGPQPSPETALSIVRDLLVGISEQDSEENEESDTCFPDFAYFLRYLYRVASPAQDQDAVPGPTM